MDYNKFPNESNKEYKIRLCKNKEIYGLSFNDIAVALNEGKSESYYRKWWNGYEEGYLDGINSNSSLDKEVELQIREIEKEKVKFQDYRRAYKKDVKSLARSELLNNIIVEKLSFVKPYEPINFCHNVENSVDMLISLSDIHYGIVIDNYWNKYNPSVLKDRLEKYLNKIKGIKDKHGCVNAYVSCNGDLISGLIHPSIVLQNNENVVDQIMHVSEIISWFLFELHCLEFNNIYFSMVAGNHSRLSNKDTAPKDERLDRIAPWYIKSRLSNNKDIFVLDNNIDCTLNLMNIRGLNYLTVHGDYDNFSSVNKVIGMLSEDIYCVHFAHLHHNASDYCQKYKVIMSGSLQGADDYSIEKRLYSKAQQLVCICSENGIECQYDIILQ